MKMLGTARAVAAHIARAQAWTLITEAALVGLPTKPKQKNVLRFDEYAHLDDIMLLKASNRIVE